MRTYSDNLIIPMKCDFNIPGYLQTSIDDYVAAIKNQKEFTDCEYCDLYSSINMAMSWGQISQSHAEELREFYLYGGWKNYEG